MFVPTGQAGLVVQVVVNRCDPPIVLREMPAVPAVPQVRSSVALAPICHPQVRPPIGGGVFQAKEFTGVPPTGPPECAGIMYTDVLPDGVGVVPVENQYNVTYTSQLDALVNCSVCAFRPESE